MKEKNFQLLLWLSVLMWTSKAEWQVPKQCKVHVMSFRQINCNVAEMEVIGDCWSKQGWCEFWSTDLNVKIEKAVCFLYLPGFMSL